MVRGRIWLVVRCGPFTAPHRSMVTDGYVHRHQASQLLQPTHFLPHGKDQAGAKKEHEDADSSSSKSTRLLIDNGLVRSAYPGVFTYLPLALRSLDKINRLVEANMRRIGGQRLVMPTMTESRLWKKTGRLDGAMKGELFRVRDRHGHDLLLSPTHEEAVTDLMAHVGPTSYKSLPIRVYQTTTKFRDEARPKFGIIRAREFLMKDMYTFDTDITAAMETYHAVTEAYGRFFAQLFQNEGVATVGSEQNDWPPYLRRVAGDTGAIGGTASHEYHVLADIGQDRLRVCGECHRGHNLEVDTRTRLEDCPVCSGAHPLQESKGIEVAHTFLLGDKYSSAMGAKYVGLDGKPSNMVMGCYGIGVSRLMAAAVEALSTEKELRWPLSIVPFSACVICPKPGSKEASKMSEAYALYDALNADVFPDDVLLDERDKVTVGKKLRDAHKTGYTYVVLFGKDCIDEADPRVELHCLKPAAPLNDGPKVSLVPLKDITNVLSYIKETSYGGWLKKASIS